MGSVSKDYSEPDSYYTQIHRYMKISGSDPPADYDVQSRSRTRKGTYVAALTPHFHARKAKGKLIPPRSYVRFDYESRTPPGFYTGTYSKVSSPARSYSYFTNWNLDPPSGSTSSRLQAALAYSDMMSGVDTRGIEVDALANIVPDLDLLTSIAEAEKTAGMIVGAREDFSKAMKALGKAVALARKGRVLRAVDVTSRTAGDMWMQWRYGWRILGYDIQNAYDYYQRPILPLIRTGRSGITRGETIVSSTTTPYYYNTVTTESRLERTAGYRISAYARFRTESDAYIADPFITAWEMIPFSFVADWFINVGNAIAAWKVIGSADQVYTASGSSFEEAGRKSILDVQSGSGTYASTPHSASAQSESTTALLIRSPLSRSSRIPIPRVNIRLTSGRLTDLAAILRSKVKLR